MVASDIPSTAHSARVVRTVLMVDIVESVRLMEEDENDTVQRWLRLVQRVDDAVLPAHGGRLVKSQGDGMLLEFQSVRPALQAAFAIQSAAAEANAGVAAHRQLHLRIGAHVGHLIADERDVYGHDVNLAARLTGLAEPGQIVVSSAVCDQLTPRLDADIEDLGERRLKGIEKPARAFRAWPPDQSARRAIETKAHMGDRPSIAVLPFRNLSGESTHDILGDVIADDLIGHLSRLTDLFVISRLSTTPFRDRLYEPRNVAEVLGVRYLLTGNIQTSGNKLRLMAELTEADDGRVIWAERFDGSLNDIFLLQDEISADVARRVVPFVREREMQRARAQRPENLTAYERTLRAIDYLHRGSTEDMEHARQMLEAAIQSAPAYSAPNAWLAYWHVRRVGQGWSPDPKKDASDANRHADQGVEKDATDSWALSVQGLVAAYLNKDLDTAISRYDTALDINPSTASAWVWSTSAHAWLGKGDVAVARSQRAIELSPLDPLMYSFTSIAGTAHAVAGQYDKAIDYCRTSLRQNRMFASTHRILAISLALSGKIPEARSAADELRRLEPGLTVRAFRTRYPGHMSAHVDLFCNALETAGIPP